MIDKNLIKNDTVEYVIQINGKKRSTIKFMKDVEQEKLLTEILKNEKTKKFFENEKIKKSLCIFMIFLFLQIRKISCKFE